MFSISNERYRSEFLEYVVILLINFQLRVVLGRQSFRPGMPTSQIKIIGVPSPVVKKFMYKFISLSCFKTLIQREQNEGHRAWDEPIQGLSSQIVIK